MSKMVKNISNPMLEALINNSAFGISVATWRPEKPEESEWIYVNKTRCKMVGLSREEFLASSPLGSATRETKAQLQKIHSALPKNGTLSLESALLCKDKIAVPIKCHLQLISSGGEEYFIVESRDMTEEKEAEAHIIRMEENARDMLTILEKEKKQIRRNMEENIVKIILPLIEQLSETSTKNQHDIITLLKERILHISKEAGIKNSIPFLNIELTRKQRLICEMIQSGMNTKDISNSLGCSPRTIDNHRNIIRSKFGISGKKISLYSFLNKE